MTDILINHCILGKSQSGWAWWCRECGDGEVLGRDLKGFSRADQRARMHKCPVERKEEQ